LSFSVTHTVSSLALEGGGPSRTVTYLTDELSNIEGCSVSLVSQKHRDSSTFVSSNHSHVARYVGISQSTIGIVAARPFRQQLHRAVEDNQPSIIHQHGIWHPASHYSAATARKLRVPYVLHPRGMLEEWSLNFKRYKKKCALLLYQMADLRCVSVFVATSENEAKSIRALGLSQPIAMIPNGVYGNAQLALSEELHGTSSRNILFMSRIHPKKGLLMLLKAWSKVDRKFWRLIVAGPDEGAHLGEVIALASKLGIEEEIDFVGEVEGQEKSELLAEASIFILPSFSENFGVVVAEALAAGVPVIATTGTPWEGLVTNDCGWWVEPNQAALVQAMQEAMSMPAAALHEMGSRGVSYSRSFSWPVIASQTYELYRWILGERKIAPGFIQFSK
jgi:glycosyltransferase involved in cell wall biosynthesis